MGFPSLGDSQVWEAVERNLSHILGNYLNLRDGSRARVTDILVDCLPTAAGLNWVGGQESRWTGEQVCGRLGMGEMMDGLS